MRDPHVTSLHYAVTSDESTSYQDPPPVTVVDTLGTFLLVDGKLTVEPAEHYSSEADARAAIEPYLRAWEMAADLSGHIGELQFQFENADIVDRHPPDGAAHLTLSAVGVGMMVVAGVSATLHVTRRTYPAPPTDFQATRDVTAAYRRWMGYRAGQEPLQAMAYFVLTLTTGDDTRQAACDRLQVERPVLNTLGDLTSARGDAQGARKAPKDGVYRPLTSAEKAWIEAVVPRLIQRLGEYAAGTTLPLLTLQDLPALP